MGEELEAKPNRFNIRVYHTPRRKGGSPPSSRHQSSANYSNLFESGISRRKELADTGTSFFQSNSYLPQSVAHSAILKPFSRFQMLKEMSDDVGELF